MPLNYDDPTVMDRREGTLRGNIQVAELLKKSGVIPVSKLTGIEVRMLPPLIKDNRTAPFLLFPGYARLYCITIVVSDVQNQLAGVIDLKGFQRIDDNEHLPINKTIYYWQQMNEEEKAPNQIHIHCSVIKSKEDIRNVAQILANLESNAEFKTLKDALKVMTTSPAGEIIDIMSQLATFVGGFLGKIEDKPLGAMVRSFTSLGGELSAVGVTPLYVETRNVDFDFKIFVRDPSLEQALLKPMNGFRPMMDDKELSVLRKELLHVDQSVDQIEI